VDIYGSPGSSYRLEIGFNLVCSQRNIGSACEDIGHYRFFPEGDLTLIWEQRKTVPSSGVPAVPLRAAGNDGCFKREILGSFSKKNSMMPCSRRNLQTFEV